MLEGLEEERTCPDHRLQLQVPPTRGSWYTRKGGNKGEITDPHGTCVAVSAIRNP